MKKVFNSSLCMLGIITLGIAPQSFAATMVKYDEHKVIVTKIAGREYHVPGEYLGDGAPVLDVQLAMLVRATLPDFTMPPKNYGKGEARILVMDVRGEPDRLQIRFKEDIKKFSPMARMDDVFGLQRYITSKGSFSNLKDPTKYYYEGNVLLKNPSKEDLIGLKLEYYIDNNTTPTVFVECGGDKSAPNPQCEMRFIDGGLVYHVGFAKILLQDWKQMRERSIRLIRSFER